MEQVNYFTDPANEIRALAMEYVHQQDLSDFTPGQVLNLYNSVLENMWDHYKRNFQ